MGAADTQAHMTVGLRNLLCSCLESLAASVAAPAAGRPAQAAAPCAPDVCEVRSAEAASPPDVAARRALVQEMLGELMGRLPSLAKLSARRHVDAIVEDIDRIAAQRVEAMDVRFDALGLEGQRKLVGAAVDEVMAKYAAMMTPAQFAIAFGLLAGMVGLGGLWLPLQQPLGALLGPLLGAAWWKWGLIAGSWGKLVSNPPQDVLFRDLERGVAKPESRFLEQMRALPPIQASQIGDNAAAGVSHLTYTQISLNGLFGLLTQTPQEALPDSLAHVVHLYLKTYWYVPLDVDHLAVLRNTLRDRVDQAGYAEAAAKLRKTVTLQATGDKQDPAPRLKAAQALLDALVEPARFTQEPKRTSRRRTRAPLPSAAELPVALRPRKALREAKAAG